MKPLLVLSILALALPGCYGAAPPRPPAIPVPALSDDATVAVHSESKTTLERVPKRASTCPQGHAEGDPACTVTTYDVTEPVTRTTTTAEVDHTPISYAQFKVITDPKYDHKLADLAELSHLCTRANVPRYVGMGLLLGGLIAITASGNAGPLGIAGWGALAAGGGSYAFGYYAYGGRKCNEAAALYREIDFSAAMEWQSVQGEQYASEMKALAEQFNAVHGRRATLEMRR